MHNVLRHGRARATTVSAATAAMVAILLGVSNVAFAAVPVLSAVNASSTETGATVTWTTDVPATTQVNFGTSTAFGSTTPLDTSTSTNHSVLLTGLDPATLFFFSVTSVGPDGDVANSAPQSFTTLAATSTATSTASIATSTPTTATSTPSTATSTPSTATSTPSTATSTTTTTATSTDVTQLRDEVSQLENTIGLLANRVTSLESQVSALQTRVANLEARIGNSSSATSTPTASTSTPPTAPSGTIDQNGQTVSAGGVIDFGGRNFGHEENITVMLNGQIVAMAHADSAGNFSTGSIRVPTTPGTYTYTFLGTHIQEGSATITVM